MVTNIVLLEAQTGSAVLIINLRRMYRCTSFPTSNSDKEFKTTRSKWINFVRRHRPNFKPSSTSVLCSTHFENSCFQRNIKISDKLGIKKTLLTGSFTMIDVTCAGSNIPNVATVPTTCERRQVSILYIIQ